MSPESNQEPFSPEESENADRAEEQEQRRNLLSQYDRMEEPTQAVIRACLAIGCERVNQPVSILELARAFGPGYLEFNRALAECQDKRFLILHPETKQLIVNQPLYLLRGEVL